MFGSVIISSVHILEIWRPKTSVVLRKILLLTWRRRRRRRIEKKCNRKQGLGRASKGEQTRKKSFELHSIDSSREILCLPYHIVMGIFGLKLLAPLHWKSFKDVKVLFILPNWIDIDHFWTHSTVFENYYAIFFFPLFVYLLYQVPYEKKNSVRKESEDKVYVVRNSWCNSFPI